jgi:hypothetical protein
MPIQPVRNETAPIRVAAMFGVVVFPIAFVGWALLGLYAGLIQLHLLGGAAAYPSVLQEKIAWVACFFLSAGVSWIVFCLVVRFARKLSSRNHTRE